MLTTTFRRLRDHDACIPSYKHLRAALRGRKDHEPITPLEILEHNGLDDALWALRAAREPEVERIARLFACDCAERVGHLHPIVAPTVAVARRFANGEATREELAAAGAAAWAAAGAAATAAERQWQAERLRWYLESGADA